MAATLCAGFLIGPAQAEEQATSTPAVQPDPRPRLAVVGFESDPEGDPRDAWIAVALQDLLSERLRRVPYLIIVPTIRLYQGRRELQGPDPTPRPWLQIAPALGATAVLRGRCAGTAQRLTLELTLHRPNQPSAAEQRVTIPVGRFFEVLDQATHWVLARFEAAPPEPAVRERVFARPTSSVTAVEYYARALSAAREEKLRDALRFGSESLRCDKRFRLAQRFLAQLELRAGSLQSATTRMRVVANQARRDGDELDRAHAELGQSLLSEVQGAFDAAQTRAETALAISRKRNDPYGQIAAISVICDLYLTRRPPPGAKPSRQESQRLARENLTQAAKWQRRLIDLLDQIGDRIVALPATNRLALIYERLDQPQQALQMHQRMLALATQVESRRHQATAWTFIGQCHRTEKRWREALDAFNRCLALANENAKPAVRILLGGLYEDMELTQEALTQFELAYEQVRNTDDLVSQFTCLRQMAQARMKLNQQPEAIKALQDAIDLAHVLESRDEEALREKLEAWKAGPH